MKSAVTPVRDEGASSSSSSCCASCFRCCGRCCISLVLTALIIAAGIFCAVRFTGADSASDLPDYFGGDGDFIPDWQDFVNEDPFNATTPEEANRWAHSPGSSGGLTLEIVNALDERWYPYFDRSIREWENGNPDVLTLPTTKAPQPDSECTPIQGRMKVCNGNYGDTEWNGINTVGIVNEQIIESVAKMNEYYLRDASDAQRQYTMCHELGHGFGLPHTDESFQNANTGECMDYTDDPAANQSPGPRNFEFLQEMYGNVTTTRRRRRRRRRRRLGQPTVSLPSIPGALRAQVTIALQEMEQPSSRGLEHLDGWQQEHCSEWGSLHSQTFVHGDTTMVVKVSKMYATRTR